MIIDLQLHSTYSDGYLTPTELADFLKKQGVEVASLTDHNTVGGLDEFRIACRKKGIKTIPGMELYVTMNGRRFNLLWYNFKENDPHLHELLRSSQIRRRSQVRRLLKRFVDHYEFSFSLNKALDKYVHYIPINKIIDDILENKNNSEIIKKELGQEPRIELVISKYFRNKKIGVLRESYINIDRVLKMRKKIGGQLILCHPAKYSYVRSDAMGKFKKMGIDGIEVLSPHHSLGAVFYLQSLARQYDFIETGGSDFHRFEGNGYPIQSSSDFYTIDSKFLRRIGDIIS